ncbi:MAG TPA: hypothetical protein VKT51_07675 [Candidatus Eremiobacteraceae bacterium]|nr:hypothetical protein [Candidatus Eremiobacteraceae bacterium]
MNIPRALIVAAVSLGVACVMGCSGRPGGQSNSGGPAAGSNAAVPATVTNPTDFPLAADDKILDAKPFNQTISSQSGTLFTQGAGTYAGHSVIAQSSGSLADAKSWLAKLEQSPPAGYSYVQSAARQSSTEAAGKFGVTYAVFRNGAKGAVVAVIDPKQAHDKLQIVLAAVDKYKMLPAELRTSIDEQVKAKLGVSVTEALDPSAPIGMTVEALRTINGSDNPAIVEVDATKQ